MSKVDWSKAPGAAELYASGHFSRTRNGTVEIVDELGEWVEGIFDFEACILQEDYEPRPTEWPSEQRIEQIGQNGATGEHYEAAESTQSHDSQKHVSAADFLSEGLKILSERGNQYGSNQRECSFPQAAEAFNAITGHNLKGSDICLIIALVKQVRQYAQPRFHEDSAVDAVNYLALQAELLKKERQ